jgi:hypothetical protein
MDTEEKSWLFKLLLAIAAVFLVSTVVAYRELKFMVAGTKTAATVDNITEIGRRGSRRMSRGPIVTTVEYHYQDADGNVHHGSYDLEFLDNKPPVGTTVMVEYVGDSSRALGRRNGGALMVFFGSLGALVLGGGAFLWRVHDADRTEPQQESAPSRS